MANKLIQDLGAGAFALTDLLEHQPIAGPPSLKGAVSALVTLLDTIYVKKIGDTMTGQLIIDIAAPASNLLDVKNGGVSQFSVNNAGQIFGLSFTSPSDFLVTQAGVPKFQLYGPDSKFYLAAAVLFRWSSTADSNGASDIGITRNTAGVLEINSSVAGTFRDLKLRGLTMDTAGLLSITSGANQRAGNLTLIGGTLTVANTSVTANSIILLTRQTAGGTIGFAVTYTVIASTSFTVTSDNALDTSTYSYLIIEVP